jgi:hypothetical protein
MRVAETLELAGANMVTRFTAVALMLVALPLAAEPPRATSETPQIEFVQEYIRELSHSEAERAAAEKELKQPGANPLGSAIHFATRMELELGTDISMMRQMRLSGEFVDVPGKIADFYAIKKAIYGRMRAIATEMMSGPKPGVDYGALAAEMPSLRAQLESIDETFVKTSMIVFLSLVDQRPDSQGHLSHLVITKQQRKELLKTLQRDFGPKIDHGDTATALVNSAGVLKDALRKDYFCSDDPW